MVENLPRLARLIHVNKHLRIRGLTTKYQNWAEILIFQSECHYPHLNEVLPCLDSGEVE
jgi:hypothetical protein